MYFVYSKYRRTPYPSYNYEVEFIGKRTVAHAGFQHVSGINAFTELVTIPEGGRSDYEHKAIKRVRYDPVVMERGVSDDMDALNVFANQFDVMQGGMMRTTEDNLLTVRIKHMDRDRKIVRVTQLEGVLITGYRTSDLDARSTGFLIEQITLEFRHVSIVRSAISR